jgi:hypothetical protein
MLLQALGEELMLEAGGWRLVVRGLPRRQGKRRL